MIEEYPMWRLGNAGNIHDHPEVVPLAGPERVVDGQPDPRHVRRPVGFRQPQRIRVETDPGTDLWRGWCPSCRLSWHNLTWTAAMTTASNHVEVWHR